MLNQKDSDVRSSGEDNVNPGHTIPAPTTSNEGDGKLQALREKPSSDIAIIGISGRFASSPNLEAFWDHLQAGESCIEKIQRKEWQTSTHSDLDPESMSPSQIKWGGMLQDIDQFDPLFFNISPLEAARMDPQQRLFLEEAYKAFEDGGYCAEQLSEKKVGVFVGARPSDYKEQALRAEGADAHLFLGNDMAILAARISYFLNCKGPSLAIDTASSSSLVAIHLACESIRTGESEMALAGGVFVMSSPEYYLMATKTQMLSPDGRCKTFDKSANGIVIGEGVGALVLKPLDAALEDGDHIHGVIVGSAMNQDGKTFGITTPSMHSQKALLSDLYQKAAIHPETLSYIEAHGTGSKLGDPIEVQALTEAFQMFTEKRQFCAIGSHKPNIGHTITSAGIAGVLKILLAMKYQKLPPTINVEAINPEIDFPGSPFFLNTELREWKGREESPRRAAVSSFGLSGTNCHLILEEPPLKKKTADEQARPSFFFPLSARTRAVLTQKVEDMINWLEKEGEKYAVEDISYTLVQGRSHFSVRSAVVAKDTNELKAYLREIHRPSDSEQAVENGKGQSTEQTDLLLKEYGAWLLQGLREDDTSDQNRYKDKITILADIYVKGYNLDWSQLFQKGRYVRVPLPTYPFTRESYWVAQTPRDQSQYLSKSYTGALPYTTSNTEGRTGAVGIVPSADPVPTTLFPFLQPLHEALSRTVSSLLKVRVEEIDSKTSLSEYGFDSITFTTFANHLNQTYQLDLTPALFFEHSTIERLVQYLQTTYAAILAPHFPAASPEASGMTRKDFALPASKTTDKVQPQGLQLPRRHARFAHSLVYAPESLAPVAVEPIAIVGMSGMFPQAPDVQCLWSNLLAGRDCISEIPPSRWNWQTYFGNPATEANRTNVKWAGIAEGIELFDPLFFGISPREAEQMDPQQRLLMMHVWKAIEDAGYAASSFSGTNTALFIGMTSSGYSERLSQAGVTIEGYSSTGQVLSLGPNRMSYFLNLHGPSEAIETACSSSLIAIHRGVNAIESGQCTVAIVGGVNILVSPQLHISYSKAGMLSEDGRCKTFGASANGYVRGEGIGILILKKLSDAEQAGDHIYAVIRGSAENHGGRASSLTAPNPRAQADLLVAAYRKAGIDPCTVSYIETHGTGTPLGDPIEINGLKTAFSELAQTIGEGPMPQASCGIGSVKSNIGHLEWAAGVTGIIKVLLQMQHKKLVKSLHCEQPNPYIQLEGSPFYLVQENQEWGVLRDYAGNALPRRAGVSSFGFGGANAHVVLEEYVPKSGVKLSGSREHVGTGVSLPYHSQQANEKPLSASARHPLPSGTDSPLPVQLPNDLPMREGQAPGRGQAPPLLIVLSAKNEERLHEQVRQLLAWVQAEMSAGEGRGQTPFLRDLAYTLQVGREAMEERLAMQVSSFTELEEKLRRYAEGSQEEGDWYRGQVKRYDPMGAFAADEDGQQTVAAWISKGKYEKLLAFWVRGLAIDWKQLYGDQRPQRISLPTYPFARERYWIPIGTSATIETGPRPTATKRAALRPLVDSPVLSDQWLENCKEETSPLPDLTSPTEVDQPEPSTSGAEPYESIGNAIGTGSERGPIPTVPVLEEELTKSLAETLYMKESDIDVEQPFVEMGLDSVVGVEWVKSLNKQYAINLATSRLYDYPTIRQLAGFLQKEGLQHQPQQVTNIAHQPEEREGGALGAVFPPINPTYQRVIVERAGGIDDLIISEAHMQELKDHEVRVAVRAFSLNFGDLLCVKGLYPTMPPYPFTPGFEASGVVLDIGQAVTTVRIGDPVIMIAGATLGGHASVMTCSEELVFHKPATLSFEEACALPVVATTMIAAFEKACLKRGEKILIHTATGGTGLIAIQLAKYYQAQIYATAGSQAKLDYLKQLGVPYRINYRETDFEQEIKHLTHNKGIDVVINTLSGDAVQKGINCLSPGGRYIELAMTALKSARTIDLSALSQNQTFYSVDLRRLAQTDPATLKHYCHEMFHLAEKRIITPSICQVFTWERLKDAYRYMENRQHIGKIVVRIPEANQASQRTHERLSSTMHNSSQAGCCHGHPEAIAIVGMSGRYPDAKNLTDFWNNLVQGKNTIREIPLSHFDISEYYDPDPAACGKISSKWLGVLDEIEYFDPFFFHLSPTEVEAMDPQQRLFLEEGYKAFEDAGYSPGLLSNSKCGVYLGIASRDYGQLHSQHSAAEIRLFGTSSAIAAARLAYLLNLKGPALAIDTACSSSLVATHLACQALRYQEIDMALVGGVNLCLTPDFYIGMCNAGMLSPDGQCKTFDASANGFVPGEGVGALVLKRLADAEADHDQIYGVIIGSGMNQDGATNGISAPSVKSQIELEREIYEKYQIDPESISYVEMHGTGTKLGDPIELEALSTVFGEKTQREQYCAIGSVKSNIGHTLAAAGIAGLHKVLLAMKQKKLVPTLHFEQPNPHFDFEASPFYVNTQVQDWPQASGTPRCAAVSSFGFSGTNAHLVIEEYISTRAGISPFSRNTETPCLFVLSAKSEPQLKSYAQEMKHWIQAHEELALEDIAFTLQVGREAMEYRLAIIADSREVLLQRLEAFVDGQASAGTHTDQVGKKNTSDAILFEADADGKSLLHIWCQQRNLEKISQLWVRGVNVDWMLLYTVGTGPAQDTGSAQGTGSEPRTIPTAPALPHRISLPTYPFVRKRYWIPAGASATIGAVGNVESSRGQAPTLQAPDSCACPMAPKRVTLRSLADPPLYSGNRADQPQPSISLSKLAQPFLQSRSDDVVALSREPVRSQMGTVGTGLTPVRVPSIPPDSTLLHTQARENVETVWSAVDLGLAPELEQELVRSLAKALDTEESDIDVERPFGEMGLDSVIGVEWIRSLNKQYASNLNASSIYDYPSIRQLAGFLQKVVLKQQQTSVSSASALSLDDILQKIQKRDLSPEEAISILSYILPSKQKGEI